MRQGHRETWIAPAGWWLPIAGERVYWTLGFCCLFLNVSYCSGPKMNSWYPEQVVKTDPLGNQNCDPVDQNHNLFLDQSPYLMVD